MFLTDTSYGVPFQAMPNEWMWRAVKIGLRMPWFRLSYLVLPENLEDQMLVCNTTELQKAVTKLGEDESTKLLNVDVISPPWMNGTDRWRMDPLERVDVGTFKGHQHIVFVLQGGVEYTDCPEEKAQLKLRGKKTFVRVPSLTGVGIAMRIVGTHAPDVANVKAKAADRAWTGVVGDQAAAGLQWLEQVAGPRAVQKFLGGKVRGTLFSGRYLIGLTDLEPGRGLISELLQMLQQGQTIPLCDVVSYYAHGKRWSLGMAIHQSRLVDVWAGAGPDLQLDGEQ